MSRHTRAVTRGRHRKPSRPIPAAPLLVLSAAFAGLAGAANADTASASFNAGASKPEPVRAALVPAPVEPASRIAVAAALTKLGDPYIWGAKGPDAFDCSGLTQWSYRQAGVRIGEDTFAQINEGRAVSDVEAGDLVFPHRGHVLLAISSSQAVEAPGRGLSVRVVPLPKRYVAARRLV